MKKLIRRYSHELNASPAEVFPLLCPVREYDWLPFWKCKMVSSESGVAELDCVFETELPEEPPSVWTCSRYEPDQAIDYVVFSAGRQIQHLSIRLSETAPGKTRLEWTRVFTPLTAEAEGNLAKYLESRLPEINKILTISLEHYLATGTLWNPEPAAIAKA